MDAGSFSAFRVPPSSFRFAEKGKGIAERRFDETKTRPNDGAVRLEDIQTRFDDALKRMDDAKKRSEHAKKGLDDAHIRSDGGEEP
jgi:hypothetical protein